MTFPPNRNAAPADVGSSAGYTPVNCEFHDVLESVATLRKQVVMEVRQRDGAIAILRAGITDIFTRDGAEYVTLDTGENIRLDALVSVDAARPRDFE